jgi:hypothetical protein
MKRHVLSVGLCLGAMLAVGILRAEEPSADARQKSVTVFPVIITPSKDIPPSSPERVAEVVGWLLERAGMNDVELGQATFTPPDTDDIGKVAAAFAQFAEGQPLKTEYALFGQFFGTPQTGPTEVRAIVVDKAGNVVFADQAGREVLARSKPKPDCPLTTSIFLVNQVRPVWNLTSPLREGAPEGKMAEIMRKRSGLPSDEELAAMDKRLKILQKNIAAAEVTVYPIHLWPGWDEAGARQLADMLNQQGICHAVVAETAPNFTVQGDPNEQKILWDTARSFREFLRENPPATQYALLADYGIRHSPDGRQWVHHVHVILCDHAGDWVLVDYQNSHHSDFRSINPKSIDDCNRLVIRRAMQFKNGLSE